MNQRFNQPSQEKARMEMELDQQKPCQLELKETENTMTLRKTVRLLRCNRRPQSSSAANVCYSFRPEKKDPEYNSEISRIATLTTGPGGMGEQGCLHLNFKRWEQYLVEDLQRHDPHSIEIQANDSCQAETQPCNPTMQSCGSRTPAPVDPEAEHQERGLFLSLKMSQNFPQTCLGPSHLSSSLIFPFGTERLFLPCPTIVFLKHVPCLVPQVQSWRVILPRNESQLQISLISDLDDIQAGLWTFEFMLE